MLGVRMQDLAQWQFEATSNAPLASDLTDASYYCMLVARCRNAHTFLKKDVEEGRAKDNCGRN